MVSICRFDINPTACELVVEYRENFERKQLAVHRYVQITGRLNEAYPLVLVDGAPLREADVNILLGATSEEVGSRLRVPHSFDWNGGEQNTIGDIRYAAPKADGRAGLRCELLVPVEIFNEFEAVAKTPGRVLANVGIEAIDKRIVDVDGGAPDATGEVKEACRWEVDRTANETVFALFVEGISYRAGVATVLPHATAS